MAKPKPRSARSKREPEDPDVLRRRGIYEKAKTFEQEVAELFSLLGYRTVVDYERDAMQFDIRMELTIGVPLCFLVECKDTGRPVTKDQVREFALKVQDAASADRRPYQKILVARSTFANNAHVMAQTHGVHLQTYKELLRSLVDLRPALDDAIHSFQGTSLERLYVEQEVVFEEDIKPGQKVEPKSLTQEVLRWLNEPSGTFLALLGDFGCGKTSFSKRLACELALKARQELAQGKSGSRMPVLIDLKDGGSTTVTLENLLADHFHRLAPSQQLNPQALLHLNREGHLLFIFDAFDETIAYTEPGRYLENLKQILRAAEGKAKVLLTCRTHYFRSRPEALKWMAKAPDVVTTDGATRLYQEIRDRPGAEVGYVMEFREKQIEEYLGKAFPPPADWRPFRKQIHDAYNLEDLAERPFLLEIIVKTLPRLLESKSDITLASLYEIHCQSWFDHTDSRLTLTRERKVALVEYLARLVWDSPGNRIHYDHLFERATEFFKDRPLTLHDKERIDYEVRTALFLHRDAEGYYSFIHRSFLEFFVARTLRAGLAADNPDCLALKRITREVAFFLELWPEAKRIPELAGRVLEAPYQAGVSENALLLLYFHARARLGPLVGPQTGKEPEIPEIRKAFAGMRPKTLHLAGADLAGAILPGVDLSGARLERAALGRADLRQACLDRACLVRADLGFVDFRNGRAEGADLSEADLHHLDGQGAGFRKAVLQSADLSFARLTRADLRDADLTGVKTVGTAFLQAQGAERARLANTAGGPKDRALDLRWQTGHSGAVASVAWSPDGRCVATGSYDGTIKIWDAESGRLLNTFSGHDNYVFSVAWSPDGTRLASGSSDKTVKVWEAASGRLLNTLAGHDKRVRSVAWSPDGTRLASGSYDKTVKVWDASSGRLLNTLAGHDNLILTVAWSPDGTRLASGSEDRMVKIWDAASGRTLSTLAHDSLVFSVAWSPDGTRLASGSEDKTVKLWDPLSGRVLNTLSHDNYVLTVAWSPDGTRLASGSHDRTVKVWEPSSGRLVNTLAGHDNYVFSVAWSPDGTRLASGSADNTVKVWEAASGRIINTLAGHDNPVRSVTWSPDGKPIASQEKQAHASTDLRGVAPSFLVTSAARSPDGRRLAVSSAQGFMEVWDLESDPPCPVVRLYTNPNGSSFAATPDGYVFGPPEALDWVRFADGWALYDVTDVPERVSEERVLAALRPKSR